MTIQIEIRPEAWKGDFVAGVRGASANAFRSLGTALFGFSAFLLTVFSANPGYSIDMLLAGPSFWQLAFITRFSGLLSTSGLAGLSLTMIFSALVGVTMTNTVVQLKNNRISMDAVGALPGFLAGGCASCGVGVLSLLGFGGALASMPFQGNSLRLGGVILLTGLIIRTGNPDTCKL